jgi:hypothetical protein
MSVVMETQRLPLGILKPTTFGAFLSFAATSAVGLALDGFSSCICLVHPHALFTCAHWALAATPSLPDRVQSIHSVSHNGLHSEQACCSQRRDCGDRARVQEDEQEGEQKSWPSVSYCPGRCTTLGYRPSRRSSRQKWRDIRTILNGVSGFGL